MGNLDYKHNTKKKNLRAPEYPDSGVISTFHNCCNSERRGTDKINRTAWTTRTHFTFVCHILKFTERRVSFISYDSEKIS